VQNLTQNQDGDLLTNSATLSIYDGAATITDTASVEVFEPEIIAAKSITSIPAEPDADDIVSYRVTLTNSTAFDAYDASFTDTSPAQVEIQTGTFSATSNFYGDVTASFTALSGGITNNAPFTLEAGEAITFTYDSRITGAVVDGQTYTNEVQASWTSISGANASERTGNDGEGNGLNNYEDNADSSFVAEVSNTFAFDKVFIGGDASHTGTSEGTSAVMPDLVVGEIVTYQLVATIGNGTTTNVSLVDQLDATNGLLHIQSATVTGGSNLTSDQGIITGMAATISNSNGDAYDDRVVIDLGTVVNSAGDPDPAEDQVIVTIQALVVNDGTNQDGDVVRNTGTLTYDTSGGAASLTDSEDVEIVEPDLRITKSLVTANTDIDAGDTITWQIVIDHTTDSTADAMDVVFSDFIPAGVTVDFATGVTVSELALNDIKGSFEIVDNELRTVAGGYDLALENSITIQISGVLDNSVEPNQVIENTATIDWSSLNGVDSNERGGDGIGPNDYTDTDTAPTATVIEELDLDKRLPTGAPTSYSIGETVTFELEVTLMEGTTPDLILQDQLPTGLRYVTNSAELDAGQSNALITFGAIAEDWNAGTGQLTLELGDVVNSSVNDGSDDSFVISYTAVVENVASNNGGVSLTNYATANAEDINDAALPEVDDDVTVSLIEPALDIRKEVDDAEPKLGQTLTYTLTVENFGGPFPANAFDIDILDNLPAGLTLDPSSVNLTVLGAPSNPSSIASNTSTTGTLAVTLDRLDIGESVEITFQADVTSSTAFFDAVITNTAGLEWTSTAGTNPDERTGDPTDPGGALNDYGDTDSQSIEVFQPDLRISKDDGGLDITPGNNIAYSLTVTNIGRTDALAVEITDDLSEYFDAGFTLVSSVPAGSVTDGVLTISLPDIADGDFSTVTITLLAPDDIPAGLESITNVANVTHQDIDPTPTNNIDDEETPVIAVPDLVVTKTDNVDSADGAEPHTYTLTYTNTGDQVAGGVVLTDELPPFTDFVSASDGGVYSGGTVTWNLDEVAPGETGTVTVTVEIYTGGEVTNTATISDDGSGGADPTPDNNTGTDTTDITVGYVGHHMWDRASSTTEFRDYFRVGENLHHRLPTAIGYHMNSGLVQPGSTVVLDVYNKQGQRIASSQTLADTGGNWVVTFRTATINEEPHKIVMHQYAAIHNHSDSTGYNFRTYFGPAYNTGTQYVSELSQKEIFTIRSAESVEKIVEASGSVIQLNWNSFEYEFYSATGLMGVI
ncbi:MAG: DUF11 domain-containing protein, partial [Verrucomicrobiales bacterium]|nr:DUF11 domain-containing protein [Verrucomicrobiales bacterium]